MLARTVYQQQHIPLIQLELPNMFGPMTMGLDAYTANGIDVKQLMYVDLAVTAILQALDTSHTKKNNQHHAPVVLSYLAKAPTMSQSGQTDDEGLNVAGKQFEAWEAETKDWVSTKQYDDLGNSKSKAIYLETFGVPRTRFPCPTKCESVVCLPSAFDAVVEVSSRVTEECDWVLYIANFSMDFEKLVEPKLDPEGTEPEATDDVYVYTICRVAFVSGKSKLVRKLLDKKDDEEVSLDELKKRNGQFTKSGWNIVWLPDQHDKTMSNADLALLRIDPSGLFSRRASKAMYTEARSFMKASDSQLSDTFREMYRSRIGARRKKKRRPGTSIWQMVKVPAERARKVIFYAKEPWYPPKTLAHYVENSKTKISRRQVEFYDESMRLILSNTTRRANEYDMTIYQTFPLQWIASSVLIHDMSTKWGQQFRCSWYKEHLHWGGGPDAEILSFAYMMGKRRIEGKYGPRLKETESSWQPLLEPYPNMDPTDPWYRIANLKNEEIFIRIIERY